jgi:hypothetical protein
MLPSLILGYRDLVSLDYANKPQCIGEILWERLLQLSVLCLSLLEDRNVGVVFPRLTGNLFLAQEIEVGIATRARW